MTIVLTLNFLQKYFLHQYLCKIKIVIFYFLQTIFDCQVKSENYIFYTQNFLHIYYAKTIPQHKYHIIYSLQIILLKFNVFS